MTEPSSSSDSASPVDWDALARLAAGEQSRPEHASVERELSARPMRTELVSALSQIGRVADPVPPTAAEVEKALLAVRARRETPVISLNHYKANRVTRLWKIAAGILVVGGAAALWKSGGTATVPTAAAHYASAVGKITNVTLSDGSTVLLAPGSMLHVDAGFGAGARTMTLTGQAKFNVVHNNEKPFTVRTQNAVFVDVGTVFAIESDAATGSRITVSEGAVSVKGRNDPASVIIKAGDRATVTVAGAVAVARATAENSDMAWTEGKLVFRDAPVADVAAALRRWYGIELEVDSLLAARTLTTTFDSAAVVSRADVGRVIAAALGGGLKEEGSRLRIIAAPVSASPK